MVFAALAARLGADASAGQRAALWIGMLGGLQFFVPAATLTLLTGGQPDVVGDDLGGLAFLLVIVPAANLLA